jgi:hypothetical protein
MQTRIVIFHGHAATTMERLACNDLKKDIEQDSDVSVDVREENSNLEQTSDLAIIVGSPETSTVIEKFSTSREIPIR